MFGIAVSYRESYDSASLKKAASAAEAREQFVSVWGGL